LGKEAAREISCVKSGQHSVSMACWLRIIPAGPFTSKDAGSLRRETPKDLIPDDTLI
jgi:hypothetical protein